ncbi:hypothetical protein [Streptomyces sp. NPDC058657]|uniref:hypothetical protein n=1 Tax=unclassified Streptomyces TaxID=2593676 RepID=UPI0036492E7B
MKMSKVFLVTVTWEYRTKGGRGRRWQSRIRWWLRLLIAAAALAGALWSAEQASAGYRATRVFQQAPDCPASAGSLPAPAGSRPDDLCVRHESAVVEGRHRSESCTVDSGGVRNCTTSYGLTLQRPGPGGTQKIGISRALHEKSREGDRAELSYWQGHLVGMSLRGETSTYPPPAQRFVMLLSGAALLLAGIGLWALLSGATDLGSTAPVGWLWLVLTVPWVIDGVQLGAGPTRWVITGLLVAVGAVWTLVGVVTEARGSRLVAALRGS